MSTEYSPPRPFQYLRDSLGYSVLWTVIVAGLGAPVLVLLWFEGYFSYGVVAAAMTGVCFSQFELAGSEGDDEDSDTSTLQEIVEFSLTTIHQNALLYVTVILSVGMASQYGQAAGLATLIIYPFWDIETTARGIPLSTGGIMVLVLAVFLLLRKMLVLLPRLILKGLRTILSSTVSLDSALSAVMTEYSTASDLLKVETRLFDRARDSFRSRDDAI